MNSLPEGRRGQALAVGIALLMATLIYLIVISPILQLYESGGDRLQARRDMVDRLRVSERALPTLRVEAAKLRDPSNNGAVLLVGSSPTVAAAQLQTRLKELVESSGAHLASSEILSPEPQDGYQKIGLHVSFSGDLTLLTAVLRGIETARPAMFVDNVEIRGGADPGEASPTLAIAFDVYGFRSL